MNDAGSPEEIEYGTVYGRIIDVSDGTEDGELHFRTRANGVLDSTLLLKSSDAIFRGNISGSATSTGSFGRGFIDDKLSVGTTAADYNFEVEGDFKLSNQSSVIMFLTMRVTRKVGREVYILM